MVAATKQVPEVDAVIVAVADELESAQLVALPPAAIAYVMPPLPVDPEVDMERACEYGKLFDEVPRDKKVMVWFALAICAVAVEVSVADPLAFVAVTADFKYCPTSAATNLYVELIALGILV